SANSALSGPSGMTAKTSIRTAAAAIVAKRRDTGVAPAGDGNVRSERASRRSKPGEGRSSANDLRSATPTGSSDIRRRSFIFPPPARDERRWYRLVAKRRSTLPVGVAGRARGGSSLCRSDNRRSQRFHGTSSPQQRTKSPRSGSPAAELGSPHRLPHAEDWL